MRRDADLEWLRHKLYQDCLQDQINDVEREITEIVSGSGVQRCEHGTRRGRVKCFWCEHPPATMPPAGAC